MHRGPLSLLWRRGAHANADKMADCLPDANGGGLEPGPCGAGGRGAQLECAAWARHLSLRAGRASWQCLARTPIDQREEIPLELHLQLRLEVHHWGGLRPKIGARMVKSPKKHCRLTSEPATGLSVAIQEHGNSWENGSEVASGLNPYLGGIDTQRVGVM